MAADAANKAPRPSSEAVIDVKSPSATPATVAAVAFRPWPRAYETTSSTVGPGIASSTAEATAKASQWSSDMTGPPRYAGGLIHQNRELATRAGLDRPQAAVCQAILSDRLCLLDRSDAEETTA